MLPFFHKIAEFRNVLPLNLASFAQPDREVILALDENSEAQSVVALVRQYPSVRWKVLVNDVPHPWRPPCKAINAGLRHACGRYVFIASPESAYAGDAPGEALRIARAYPGGVALGRVGFAQFDDLRSGRSVAELCDAKVPRRLYLDTFYGSICGPRAGFEAVDGYAESFTGWGSDDDNVRIRLEMAGYTLLACPGVRLLHMSFKPRSGPRHPELRWDADSARIKCSPESIRGNGTADWGRSFSRMAYATAVAAPPAPGSAGTAAQPRTAEPLPRGTCIPIRSARRCRACGRLVFHEAPTGSCALCEPARAVARHPADPAAATRRTTGAH